MKYKFKKKITFLITMCMLLTITVATYAHSGRTDSSGGHKDNQNKSGLGSYHYHCGGHPPHLHDNGVCPYSSSSSSSSSSSASTSSSSKSTTSTSSSKSSNSESVTTLSSVEATPTPEPIIKATSVEINENVISMKVGETNKLTATITPESTADKNITWESSDENIATVSSTGKIVALEPGVVSITVSTSNGKTDTIEITIEEVKEENNENNTIVVPIQSSELNNTITTTTEDSDAISGVIGLGLIGGGSYWGYKKYKKSKK